MKVYAAAAPIGDDEAIMLICALIPSPAYVCATVEHCPPTDDPEEPVDLPLPAPSTQA